MIKLVFCLNRRPEIPDEEFHRYWRDEHAPLVAKHAGALGIRRYVQAHGLNHDLSRALAANRGSPEGFDGVAEAWFDSIDALSDAASSEPGRTAGRELFADERRFIDHSRSPIFLTEEHPIFGG
jgi:uncharacterized protein (TIGR02118 family)